MKYKIDDKVWFVPKGEPLNHMVRGRVVSIDETNKTYDIRVHADLCVCNLKEIDIIGKDEPRSDT